MLHILQRLCRQAHGQLRLFFDLPLYLCDHATEVVEGLLAALACLAIDRDVLDLRTVRSITQADDLIYFIIHVPVLVHVVRNLPIFYVQPSQQCLSCLLDWHLVYSFINPIELAWLYFGYEFYCIDKVLDLEYFIA